MPLIRYEDLKLGPRSLETVEQANEIIAEFEAQGFDLTLRQLFYQFVARGLIPNTQREYKRLGSVVNDGRVAGLIDWNSIVDRTRNLRALPHWDAPEDIVRACAQQFNHDLWADQPGYCEVWIEKDALVGVIEGVCNTWDVPHFSCRGYTSQSEMWAASQRIRRRTGDGEKPCIVFHLGDHDPSGVDMTRDVEDRLRLFGADVSIVRLALNMDQVRQFRPPPNPAKITDSRAAGYIGRHGRESWELDALDPRYIARIVSDAVAGYVDAEKFRAAQERQRKSRALLAQVSERWADVVGMLDGGGE